MGEIPRRGGPNDVKADPVKSLEDDNELNKELQSLSKEVDYEQKTVEINAKIQSKFISINKFRRQVKCKLQSNDAAKYVSTA